MDLRDRILKAMASKGISKADLVKITGIKKSTVYTFFQRNIELSLETIRPIAKVLGVSLDYLITGEDSLPVPYILQIYNELTDTGKELLLAYAKGVYASENGELPKK